MNYLLAYSIICIAIVLLVERGKRQTSERFFVAERQVGGVFGALAVAASWIWAPALFVSTQVGYQWGYSGLFWFVVPNMLALMIFAPVAHHLRRRLPQGYSYIEYIRRKDGSFREVQLAIQLLVQILCCAIQLTAGAELLTCVTGIDYWVVTLFMAVIPLSYCLIGGLVSSIVTDGIQYLIIAGSIGVIYTNSPIAPSWSSLLHVTASAGSFNVFHPFGQTVVLQFGLASFMTLIFGIFSNHQQWQRAFAATANQLKKTFFLAGLLHAVVTFSLGTLGILISQLGYVPSNAQFVGAEFISLHMPTFCSIVFTIMSVSALCATTSSALCAFGSLYATEIAGMDNPVHSSRKAMLVLSVLAAAVALVRVPVMVLWMFCGLIRLGTAAPTIASVFLPRFSGKTGTVAILSSICLAAPIFIWASTINDQPCRTVGMLICLILSLGICIFGTAAKRWAREQVKDLPLGKLHPSSTHHASRRLPAGLHGR